MRESFVPPQFAIRAFNCPLCGAYAHQKWYAAKAEFTDPPKLIGPQEVEDALFSDKFKEEVRQSAAQELQRIVGGEVRLRAVVPPSRISALENIHASQCYSCSGVAIWNREVLIYPRVVKNFQPNDDLSPEIQRDFREAADVLDLSPRAAGALLRLCLQKLCLQLGLSGDINSDIGELVKKGLDRHIQKSLDLVRVLGNESVHPGSIDLRDDRDTVSALFLIINRIAQDLITHPKEVEALYASLPATKIEQIEQRDIKVKSTHKEP